MVIIMRALTMTLLLCLAPLTDGERKALPMPLAVQAPVEIVEGIYHCQRQSQDGTKAQGSVTIGKPEQFEEGYAVSWNVIGEVHVRGLGVIRGNKFCVSAGVVKDGALTLGIWVFQIDGKNLKGTYQLAPGSGKSHPETLTLIKAFAKET